MPDEGRELFELGLCNSRRWLKCARGVVAARRTGHDDERYARALIVGRRKGVAAIVAGYAAVRENDIELRAAAVLPETHPRNGQAVCRS